MSGYNQAIPPILSGLSSTMQAVNAQTYGHFHEIEAKVKAEIWRDRLQLESVLPVDPKEMKSEDKIELRYARDLGRQDSDGDNLITQRRMEFAEYTVAPTKPLHQNRDRILQVEVKEASHALLPFPAVVKLYHCQDYSNLKTVIQEAFVQVTLSSAYTCKLLDLSIREGSKSLIEVGLVMERMERDLQADINHRTLEQNPYIYVELKHILKCVVEALMYAKLRVNYT